MLIDYNPPSRLTPFAPNFDGLATPPTIGEVPTDKSNEFSQKKNNANQRKSEKNFHFISILIFPQELTSKFQCYNPQ